MVQYVIDACAHANVTPFLLTKVRFPSYLKFSANTQVGISLMPEEIRQQMAPHGSPSEELLESLAWAVSTGAQDPVIRLFVQWQQRQLYPPLLKLCRDRLGTRGWRVTLDILRFTPTTLSLLEAKYPDLAPVFAQELAPNSEYSLRQVAGEGRNQKKVRPPIERQIEIYRSIRSELNALGCQDVPLTACKGDPDELKPLIKDKIIRPMPCACYGP